MKISDGGIGAPLECAVGDVLIELGKAGPIEVTLDQLVELVRCTDRFTSLSLYGRKLRHLTPVGPTAASIRRVLKKKELEGFLTIERRNGPFTTRIVLNRPWDTSGDWQDEHDPTQCSCGATRSCFLHYREEFLSTHARCAATFCCGSVRKGEGGH